MTRILLVEDSSTDAFLIQEALRQADFEHTVEVAVDGIEAMARLRDSSSTRPDLVLLDLNLPRKDGREVLAEVKGDPDLSSIPVIVLTTSSAPPDVAFCYTHHANSYIRKPLGLDRLIEAAAAIRDFWGADGDLAVDELEQGVLAGQRLDRGLACSCFQLGPGPTGEACAVLDQPCGGVLRQLAGAQLLGGTVESVDQFVEFLGHR